MPGFGFKRLDAYAAAIEFVARAHELAKGIPRSRPFLADQLLRAAVSIPLNLAEGAGEYSGKEKARFFRMARRSANECAAMLDVLYTISLIDERSRAEHEELLDRIAAMLTRMTKLCERRLAARTSTRTSTRTERT